MAGRVDQQIIYMGILAAKSLAAGPTRNPPESRARYAAGRTAPGSADGWATSSILGTITPSGP